MFFCIVLILRERENSSHFGQCLLYRYFWVHLWPLALQVRFFFIHRLIIVHVGWAHEGVKHWPRKFFSKCRQQDSNQGAHLIEPSTSTLRPRAQPTWPTLGLRLRLCKTIIQYRGEFVTLLDHLLLTFSCPIYQAYWMTTIII